MSDDQLHAFDIGAESPAELKRKNRAGKALLANPMIPVYGPGPADTKCGDCVYIIGLAFSRTYYKCRLRSMSGSATSDHRVGWPTCGWFEARP